MRNVNLNILKFLGSIHNFCLSLANIGLEVRSRESEVSIQETGDYFYVFFPHPTPHTPHPTSPLSHSRQFPFSAWLTMIDNNKRQIDRLRS
ncbi:hypothetical protein O53_372 [Microcystis aeruginosa TAIHU98]|uniref:Uncharacterized protein n=1 Tax=Microcystis aeruginosa TAIHU98 TaxID=1134457 RepID=L7EAR8_MICAE|nr:hypothetical protein O53_372 [Microcystis aeruginosa TAIHU98]